MREAFGGTFMLNIALTFLVIYVCFMAGAVQYARAFRVKNQVINILEQNQYSPGDQEVQQKIRNDLGMEPYDAKSDVECSDNGGNPVCIIDMTSDSLTDSNQKYYKVVVWWQVRINFFNNLTFRFPVSGETKTIYTS